MSQHELEVLAPDVQALLRNGRSGSPPSSADRARLFSRVGATLGLPAAVGLVQLSDAGASTAGSAATTTIPSVPPAAVGVAKGGLAALLKHPIALAATTFALGTATGVGVHAAWQPTRTSEPASIIAPVNTQATPPLVSQDEPAVVPVHEDDASPTPPVRPVRDAGRPRVEPAKLNLDRSRPKPDGRDADLAAERALIELARTALSRGDSATALSTLMSHETRFPAGKMLEERAALRIQALVGAGRLDEARRSAVTFRATFPRSLFLPVVDSVLDSTQ